MSPVQFGNLDLDYLEFRSRTKRPEPNTSHVVYTFKMTLETSNTRATNGQYERVLNNLPETVRVVSQMMIKFEDVVQVLNDKYNSSEVAITRQDICRILIELLQSVHSVSATREPSSWNQFTHDRLQDLKLNSETKGDRYLKTRLIRSFIQRIYANNFI